jgi:Ca2+-binding EF-hand superfamily protein
VEEAHKVLREELGLDEKKSRALVTRFDLNKDGGVSYVEFTEFYLAIEDK